MVGPWPLVPHQDFLQYVYHVFLMQAGLKLGYYMEGQIRAISRHMEGQEKSDSNPHQGKLQKYLAFYKHLDVHGFKGYIRVYTLEMV